MPSYVIESALSGRILGIYEASGKGEALDALARAFGFDSYLDGCKIPPLSWAEIIVTENNKRFSTIDDLRKNLEEQYSNHELRLTQYGELYFREKHSTSYDQWHFKGYIYEWIENWKEYLPLAYVDAECPEIDRGHDIINKIAQNDGFDRGAEMRNATGRYHPFYLGERSLETPESRWEGLVHWTTRWLLRCMPKQGARRSAGVESELGDSK